MSPVTSFSLLLIIAALIPLAVAILARVLYPRLAPRSSHDLMSPLAPPQILAIAEELFPQRGAFGYGRWWARTHLGSNVRLFATYPVPYISFGGLLMMIMGRTEQVSIRTQTDTDGTRVLIESQGHAAYGQAHLLTSQIGALSNLPQTRIRAATERMASIVAEGQGRRCSACNGYVRQDAASCKHCSQRFTGHRAVLLSHASQLPNQEVTAIVQEVVGGGAVPVRDVSETMLQHASIVGTSCMPRQPRGSLAPVYVSRKTVRGERLAATPGACVVAGLLPPPRCSSRQISTCATVAHHGPCGTSARQSPT